MVPLQAGGSRLWRAVRRAQSWSLSGALCVSLVLGGILGQSSLATAQTQTPTIDPAFFPATGYRISSPQLLDFFQHRGGVRTFGYPISNEFPLLGKRMQLFQRQLLQIDPDGVVTPASILDPDFFPISRIDGLNLPQPDPDIVGAAPTPDSPEFSTQALGFINVFVPDEWNGLPVNFQSTFLSAVTCADAFGADPCDPTQLPAYDLEIWGLPTSLPTSDPLNPDFVYQRFQRGIMHFSRATGATQGLLLGDWVKRVIIGVDLSPDLNPEVRQSRLFAQYAPSQPLALDRPAALPDSSLAQAFRADSLNIAGQGQQQFNPFGQMQPEPTLPTNVAQTATAVALTTTAVAATQAALNSQQSQLTATALALTATAVAGGGAITPTPGGVVSNVPVENVGCLGDEQMWFVPRKPNIGVHVSISVTSQRHHDARSMALGGPVDPGPVTEHVGPLGFIWTWTVVPSVEAFYQWTFFADGLRPCITSGFNAFAPLGATATPTVTPQPSATPGASATPTPTALPARPSVSQISPTAGNCGDRLRILGHNFGNSQISGDTVTFAGTGGSTAQTYLAWTDTEVDVLVPTSLLTNARYSVIVSTPGGSSLEDQSYQTTPGNGCIVPTSTPFPTSTPTPTPTTT